MSIPLKRCEMVHQSKTRLACHPLWYDGLSAALSGCWPHLSCTDLLYFNLFTPLRRAALVIVFQARSCLRGSLYWSNVHSWFGCESSCKNLISQPCQWIITSFQDVERSWNIYSILWGTGKNGSSGVETAHNLPKTVVAEDLIPFFGLQRHCVHVCKSIQYTQRTQNTHKTHSTHM